MSGPALPQRFFDRRLHLGIRLGNRRSPQRIAQQIPEGLGHLARDDVVVIDQQDLEAAQSRRLKSYSEQSRHSILCRAMQATLPMPDLTGDDLRQGAVVLSLVETSSEWVHRRVEQVTLADPAVSERRVSIDFTLAPDPATPPIGQDGTDPRYLVPITWITKHRITNFNLRDESNRALPALTQLQGAVTATAALAVHAAELAQTRLDFTERVQGRRLRDQWEPFPIDLLHDFWVIAAAKRKDAIGKWATLHHVPAGLSDGERDESLRWRKAITEDKEFMTLASDVCRNFLILTQLEGRSGTRRIVKLSYDEQRLGTPLRDITTTSAAPRIVKRTRPTAQVLYREFQRFFAMRAKRIEVPAQGIGRAQCFHLEVAVPEGIFLTRAKLVGYPARLEAVSSKDDGPEIPEDSVTRSSQCAHMHLSGVAPSSYGVGIIALRLKSELVLRGALINAWFTVVLLGLVAAFLNSFESHIDATVALLLGVSGGVSLYLARPREPGMSTAMHSGVRLLALGNALAAFGAIAVVLTGGKCETTAKSTEQVCTTTKATEPLLIGLAGVAALMLVILSIAIVNSRTPPEQRAMRRQLRDDHESARGFG